MDLSSLQRSSFPAVGRMTLSQVGQYFSLRCDAKQVEPCFVRLAEHLDSVDSFILSEVLPAKVVKGTQPQYLEAEEPDSVPVLSTLCVQKLFLVPDNARFISAESFETTSAERIPAPGDLLLTMDGGPSIGKPAVFDLDGSYAVDSHVAILRPDGITSEVLAILLASPIGQLQFRRAESGASGQTAVTEEDLRRFRFPVLTAERQESMVKEYHVAADEARELRRRAAEIEANAWGSVVETLLE